MKSKKTTAILLIAIMTAGLLSGCGNGEMKQGEMKQDDTAMAIAQKFDKREYRSILFPSIADVKEIPAPICVIVEEGKVFSFLKTTDLPIASEPDSARSILIITLNKNATDETFSCDIKLANNTKEICIDRIKTITVEKRDELASMLNSNFSFVENIDESDTLLARIKAYEEALFNRDYLTAINNSKDSYEISEGVRRYAVCNPLVYMTDTDYVCEAVGGDIAFFPAERNQYAPPTGKYTRPEISGAIALGFSSLKDAYTISEVETTLKEENDTFCFLEIIGIKPYGIFTDRNSGENITAHTYDMRISVISLNGDLFGYKTVSCDTDTSPLAAQLAGILLSRDKYKRAVFHWGYINVFLKSVR